MSKEIITRPGCKPGNNKAVRQHQAMAQGFLVTDGRDYKNDIIKQRGTGRIGIPGGLGSK